MEALSADISNVHNFSIEALWQEFSKALPAGMSEHEKRERRRMFYAGATGMLVMMSERVSELSDDAGVAVIEALHQESQAFHAEMMAGRA